ncbi:hypothetical protein BC830DRAFT_134490 [Chytriomyces sp. MP71]|nr:hypothetical protein BC830DRAFT_134490 [Chytriomyces sp. MP71]
MYSAAFLFLFLSIIFHLKVNGQLLNQAQIQAMNSQAWLASGSVDTSYCGYTGTCIGTSVPYFVKSAPAVFYMQVIRADKDDPTKDMIETAAFYPRVDEYSELTIPNSNSLMTAWTDASHSIRIQMIAIVNNQFYRSNSIAFTGIDQTIVCVPGRLFVNGGIQWAQTDCALAACSCVESICAADCAINRANITVRVAWTGTDGNGAPLTSLGSDIWHFENAV